MHHDVSARERLAEADRVAGEGLHEPHAAVPQVLLRIARRHGDLVVPCLQQPLDDLAADEAGAARDHDSHMDTSIH
jgi:hypothetical protein